MKTPVVILGDFWTLVGASLILLLALLLWIASVSHQNDAIKLYNRAVASNACHFRIASERGPDLFVLPANATLKEAKRGS